MPKVTLINTGEGQRTIVDANNRPHSFPCGLIASIDIHEAHIRMLTDPNKSKLVIIPDGVQLDPRFIEMMTVLTMLRERDYATNLAEVRRVLGKDAMRMRPELAEMRARLQRVATKYAAAGFTSFDAIIALKGETEVHADHNALALAATVDIQRRETKLNVPRHMLREMQALEERRNLVEDDAPSKDARATSSDGKRERLGRVPLPQPSGISTVPLSELPTAKPGELPSDGRSAAEQIAAIEERTAQGENRAITDMDDDTPDVMEEYDHVDDTEGEALERGQRRRVAKKTVAKKAVTKPVGRAKKTVKKAVAKKPAKKAGSKR